MAMPDRWRAALRGEGEVDLSAARVRAESQLLLMPRGLIGGLKSLVAQRALTRSRELVPSEWPAVLRRAGRSEEHTSELQSLMRISYAVFCLKNKTPKLTLPNT